MSWTWDPDKAASNLVKHQVSFDLAAAALDDPAQLSVPDPHADGDRRRTLAHAGRALLFVVHTAPRDAGGTGPIISARRASTRERSFYEQGRS